MAHRLPAGPGMALVDKRRAMRRGAMRFYARATRLCCCNGKCFTIRKAMQVMTRR